MCEYGLCLEQGLGVKQNMKQAVTEFKQAMYKNYRPAESHLREISERERAQTFQ